MIPVVQYPYWHPLTIVLHRVKDRDVPTTKVLKTMARIELATADLASICIHSTLYGIYLFLFSGCLYVLLFRKRQGRRKGSRKMNKTLLTVAIILFVLITAHWILQIVRLFQAFIYRITYENPNDYYAPYYAPMYIASSGLTAAEVVVADMTMVYRLYLVWGRNWRIVVVPSITTAAALVTGIHSVEQMTHGRDYATYFAATKPWVMALFAAEIGTNLSVTALISYRIWSVERVVNTSRTSTLPIIAIIVESASIYTTFLIFILITFLANSNLQDMALELISPAIGITFSLIIVRVGLGMATEERGSSTGDLSSSEGSPNPTNYSLSSLSVNISQQLSRQMNRLTDDGGPTTGKRRGGFNLHQLQRVE